MSVRRMSATIECDECGFLFLVALDPAAYSESFSSLWDYAEDAVRRGTAVQSFEMGSSSSVQDDKMLCPSCTRKADNAQTKEER